MLWNRKKTISDDLKGWIFDSFDWADTTFGTEWIKSRQLVTATKTFFSAGAGDSPEVAQQIADDIACLLPIQPIDVAPMPVIDPEYRQSYQDLSTVAGLYHHDDEAPLVNYDVALMRQPVGFINTMTHELMHARLANHIDGMPGGEPMHELSTDLHCITHGFGLFAIEGPAQVGWSGYMTQESRAYALAEFLARHGIDDSEAISRLNPRGQKALTRAIKEHASD
ncbi:hypothetical protein DS901_05520 [Loktanella sp. D2R18]|uniref:hypothetical protein n=1 Tax=Rhodobacterales TaxID=204455 RepID=UPI000DEA68A0|nr:MULTISPECIES: hypothetical protein [Rhodobacterales]MDO6590680.1 hypothetical protein [Yoonia sp. 1_MG-2023]RBW44696.1 hypothetical protein DS901_05520 [Loktanella sp. D2R18]